MRSHSLIGAVYLSFAIVSAGCGRSPASDLRTTADAYSIGLTAAAMTALPSCTLALAGTVAFVSSPPTLLECSGWRWRANDCTDSNAGSVAYASRTQVLVACVRGDWTQIPAPAGPAGLNSLVLVTTEPSGTNCALGGLRVDTGLDSNRNGTLDIGEIQHTAYVCTILPRPDALSTPRPRAARYEGAQPAPLPRPRHTNRAPTAVDGRRSALT